MRKQTSRQTLSERERKKMDYVNTNCEYVSYKISKTLSLLQLMAHWILNKIGKAKDLNKTFQIRWRKNTTAKIKEKKIKPAKQIEGIFLCVFYDCVYVWDFDRRIFSCYYPHLILLVTNNTKSNNMSFAPKCINHSRIQCVMHYLFSVER